MSSVYVCRISIFWLWRPDSSNISQFCPCRFIFFVESNEKGDALTALAKSNKKALKSVGAVLRLEDHDAEEALVTDVLIDFRVEEA